MSVVRDSSLFQSPVRFLTRKKLAENWTLACVGLGGISKEKNAWEAQELLFDWEGAVHAVNAVTCPCLRYPPTRRR